jgi:hypothetical protein
MHSPSPKNACNPMDFEISYNFFFFFFDSQIIKFRLFFPCNNLKDATLSIKYLLEKIKIYVNMPIGSYHLLHFNFNFNFFFL